MDIHDLEIAQLNKLGVISRPFSPLLGAQPKGGTRLKEVYYSRARQSALLQAFIEEVVGCDVSKWQGNIDWVLAKDRGLKFAFIRAGYGNSYIDEKLANNRTNCGLPFSLYWYAVPSGSAISHATTFARVWKEGGGVLYPVIDLEETGGLTKIALEAWLKSMIAEFKNLTGVSKLMVYSSANFLNTYLPISVWMYSFPLFQAAWTANVNPPLPTAWRNRRFHQYSATGDGKYYGMQSTYLDMNRYSGTWEKFVEEFGINAVVPSASPSPSAVIPCENVLRMRVKETSAPFVNVRTGPGTQYQDVGDLVPGNEFEIDTIAGTDAWGRISEGQWSGYWVCIQKSGKIYCETSRN